MGRVYNFSAGPAVMPVEALQAAAREMLDCGGTGMSVMEMSHRSKMYLEIYDRVVAQVRALMNVPDAYAILMLQGGATQQFSAVPMNLMTGSGRADYVDSGNFAHGALVEARRYGQVNVVASSREQGYVRAPEVDPSKVDDGADYLYLCTNNTIYGTRCVALPDVRAPLVADMSSNILSEVYDVSKFGLIFAGAQKNIGPAGLTLVIVRKDLAGRAMAQTPKVMDYRLMIENDSMLNTPPTYAIYMAGLCLDWLEAQGGVAAIEGRNVEKAKWLYDCLDESALFQGVAEAPWRSRMNVTFRTGSDEKDAAFIKFAAERGLVNLKGHRATGGMRASIYNAMPPEGVQALVAAMKEFERKNA